MKTKNGFTLIELIVVIAIVGGLIVLVTTTMFGTSNKLNSTIDTKMIAELKDAAKIYAIDQKLKDCHDCTLTNLNSICVVDTDPATEKDACMAYGISTNLGILKAGDYFSDITGHCHMLDNNNEKIPDPNLIIDIYRYNGEYFVELNGITCKK